MARRRVRRRTQTIRVVQKKPPFNWIKVFGLALKIYKERMGKWVIAVNGIADPRRYQSFKEMHVSLQEDINLNWLPEGCNISAFKARSREIAEPTFLQCVRWSFKRELRIWRIKTSS